MGREMIGPKRYRKMKKRLESLLIYFLIATALTVFLFPILWMTVTSFKLRIEAFTIPPVWFFKPTLDNYRFIFDPITGNLSKFVVNSAVVAILSTFFSVTIGTLAAYSLARHDFKGNQDLTFWIVSIRMMPPIAAIIPLYLVANHFGLLDKYLGLVLVYFTFNLPFTVLMMKEFFRGISIDMEESAMIDGCSRFGAFLRIALPLSAPGLAATGIFCFIQSWSEFFFALIFTGINAKTAPVAIGTFITDRAIEWGPICAAGVVVAGPILVFTFLVQRHLVRGLTFGAIK